ncbi:MAG: membrane protein insertase YidC [Pseudomonadota bacterium]
MNNTEPSHFKNTLLAIVLSVAVLFLWDAFMVPDSAKLPAQKTQETVQQDIDLPQAEALPVTNLQNSYKILDDALQDTDRLVVRNDKLLGSINLKNGRFDDLILLGHKTSLDEDSTNIRLFAPGDTSEGFFAELGYTIDGKSLSAFDGNWRIAEGGSLLSPQDSITLIRQSDGLKITRNIALDKNYMFTITDKIENISNKDAVATPYALLKKNRPASSFSSTEYVVHTGFIGWIENALEEVSFDTIKSDYTALSPAKFVSNQKGWIGITEKYWMATLIPSDANITARALYNPYANQDAFQSDYVTKTQKIAAGQSIIVENRLFAGAKSVPIIENYEKQNIPGFDYTVDWGWFWFFTKPIFWGLLTFYELIGNYGIAILILTLFIKALFFPLANKSYVAMSRMKKLQPEMEKIRAKYGDDPMAQQKELVELYRKEKVNPVAGCWPLLLQIPVFYALYKVLSVTLELRHAPFFGFITDLSAKDPTSLFNLFGLLPYDPAAFIPSFLNIGILPILMGITMWMQQSLNPASPDPMQRRVMGLFPIVFTFILAPFATGLVVYWTWNNILSIVQQALIMKKQGVPVEFRPFKKSSSEQAEQEDKASRKK